MSLHHAASGEIIQIQPFGRKLPDSRSVALLKAHQMEVMRLVLPEGKTVPEHQVSGELTMQCLEGSVELRAHGKTQTLHVGELVHLESEVSYSLHAPEHASLLLTMVLLPDQGSLRESAPPENR